MENIDNGEEKNITLLNIKKNLKDYSMSKLIALASILINSLNDLTKEKKNMKQVLENCELNIQVTELVIEKRKLKEELEKYEDQMVELSVQVTEHQATYKTLTCENDLLNNRIDEISKKQSKVKREGRRIQYQLEEELTNVKADLIENSFLEEELSKLKTKLVKAIKCTTSSHAVTNSAIQEYNS